MCKPLPRCPHCDNHPALCVCLPPADAALVCRVYDLGLAWEAIYDGHPDCPHDFLDAPPVRLPDGSLTFRRSCTACGQDDELHVRAVEAVALAEPVVAVA